MLTTAKRQQPKQLEGDGSDMEKSKSTLRNLQSDGTHSTNTSSKINSDSILREPKLVTAKSNPA